VDRTEPADEVEVPAPCAGLPVSARLVAKGETSKPAHEGGQLPEAVLLAAPEQPGKPEPERTSAAEPSSVPPVTLPFRALRTRRGRKASLKKTSTSKTPSAKAPSAKAPNPKAASPKAANPKAPSPKTPGSKTPGAKPSGSKTPGSKTPGPKTAATEHERIANSTSAGAGRLARLVTEASRMARQNPVEIIAILLLGVGGALYPPIWLLGAGVALPSKKWDIRDKLLGIVLPVLLVIFGTVIVLVLGGQQSTIMSYAHEAWVGAERISRVTAFAGAAYLLWALRRTRRKPPKQPPWRLSPRFG
jgi:hypothetical protein